jgi:3-mercaptopyruvate sulfurtransferase SseA
MNTRSKVSIVLLILGIILAFLPLSGKYSLHGDPQKLLSTSLDQETYMTPDQVARAVVSDDSTIQLIDLRKPSAFNTSTIPGSVNIPYGEFLSVDLESYLNNGVRNIFYSDNDYEANYAFILARGIGYKNCCVMYGGLDAWYTDVMNSSFNGETISARENATFETRYKARRMFSEINSMPDSLKMKYRAAREFERKKLDGGCE